MFNERHRPDDDATQSNAGESVKILHEMLLKSNGNPCQYIQDALSLHPAALMAPITETVEQNGVVEEMASPHPTRLLLFRTLQRKLQEETASSSSSSDIMSCYWDCLVLALQVARTLEGTRKHAGGTFCDVPVAWMLQHGTNRLDVFWAFLQRHPETSRAFANVLLFQKGIKNRSGSACACDPETTSHFLQRMHAETDLAASILTLAIQNWPLTLWLSKKGTFARRLLQGIESALRVTHCCFQREKHSRNIISLMKSFLRHVPWQEKLQNPCAELVELLIDSLSNNNESGAAFLELCGGQEMPEGGEIPMSPFVRAWLEADRGIQWVKNLLQLYQQNQKCTRVSASHPALCAILTSNFIVFADNDDLWQQFHDTFCSLSGERRGFELMAAILKGRHAEATFLRTIQSAWWDRFIAGLFGDHSIAATVCTCCGYLRTEDWVQHDNAESILEAIFLLCSDHRVSAKWRTLSLKGLGNVCSNLFTASNALSSQQNKVLQVARTSMNDSNAQVRCMALFVVGNLSFALRSREASLQSIPLWIIVSDQCLAKLQEDDNEKVINNAIRSIGQIAAIFLVQPNNVDQLLPYVSEIVDVLRVRIQISLPNVRDAAVLSWKQRSARKRHCWGSCNSIAIIFQSLDHKGLDCSEVLEALVEVLEEGGNEKVVMSASKAIRSYRCPLEINLVLAFQACVHALEHGEKRSRLTEEMEMLLPVLLQNMTPRDVTCWILKLEDSKDRVLRWLFSWMMSHSVPSECFLMVSDSVNRSGIQVDISVEQMFATAVRNCNVEDDDEL